MHQRNPFTDMYDPSAFREELNNLEDMMNFNFRNGQPETPESIIAFHYFDVLKSILCPPIINDDADCFAISVDDITDNWTK
jgi:hypothetical protein